MSDDETTNIRITAVQRYNILNLIAYSFPEFDLADKYEPVWSDLIGDWDWPNMHLKENIEDLTVLLNEDKSETMDVGFGVTKMVISMVKKNLNAKPPRKEGERDTRWVGLGAIKMIRLHRELLSKDPPKGTKAKK